MGNNKYYKPTKIFIPSVKEYCSKHKYEHLLINESEYDKRFGNYDFLDSVNKHYSLKGTSISKMNMTLQYT